MHTEAPFNIGFWYQMYLGISFVSAFSYNYHLHHEINLPINFRVLLLTLWTVSAFIMLGNVRRFSSTFNIIGRTNAGFFETSACNSQYADEVIP